MILTHYFDEEAGRVFEIRDPRCKVCGDTGEVTLPVLYYANREYIGHGACDCPTCGNLTDDLKFWMDLQELIPKVVLDHIQTGKTLMTFAVSPCPMPECENGKIRRALKRNLNGPRFEPVGWIEVKSSSPEGRQLIARWLKETYPRLMEEEKRTKARGQEIAKLLRSAGRGIGRPIPKAIAVQRERVEEKPEFVAETERRKQAMHRQLREQTQYHINAIKG